MEPLWKLVYLLEPDPLELIFTTVAVTFGSAFRVLNYGKEMEWNRDFSGASITLDKSQALMIPIMSSCSLLLMFFLFSSVSQLLTAFTAVASASSLFLCLLPCVTFVKSQFGLSDPFVLRCCSKSFTRTQAMLWYSCRLADNWALDLEQFVGISICVAFRFFGANVLVSVATQQASNHVHTVANSLSLPGLQLITKKPEQPVKIMFPRHLLGGVLPGTTAADFMMLGLGDMARSVMLVMAIPAMLLALILCFDYSKSREIVSLLDPHSAKGQKNIWYAITGYIVELTALAAGVLTHSPQPALLYLEVWTSYSPILDEERAIGDMGRESPKHER